MDEAVKSSIISACKAGHVQEVQAIIRSVEGESGYVDYCVVAMFEACRMGNVDIVEYLVHTVSDSESIINCTDETGETPLHIASKQLNVAVCRVILQTGVCKINRRSNSGQTPLHLAIGSENGEAEAIVEITLLLLSSTDCDPQIVNSQGYTPLNIAYNTRNDIYTAIMEKWHGEVYTEPEQKALATNLLIAAVQAEDVEKVQQLLNCQHAHYHPNVTTILEGNTLLIIACKQGALSIVQVLLSHENCEINAQNNFGNTALHCAAARCFLKGVLCLIHHEMYKSNLTNKVGITPLHIACSFLNVEIVKELLKKGDCNVNLQTKVGQTPLHLAVQAEGGKKVEVVQLLLAISDCDPNIQNSEGDTPLMVACKLVNEQVQYYSEGNIALRSAVVQSTSEVIDLLVHCEQYTPDIPNKLGETLLHIACSQLKIQKVEVLLKDGRCDVNAQTNTGETPLHLVLRSAITNEETMKESITRLLLSVPDCNPTIADAQGVTPLQIANKKGIMSVFTLILEKACEKGHSKMKEVVEEAKTLTENDLLHLSAQVGATTVMKYLLNLQGSSSIVNKVESSSGTTPLIAAIQEKCMESVELLGSQCCDLNVRSASNGDTPLIVACKMAVKFRTGDYLQIIRLLLSSDKCDLNCQNDEGNTALHISTTGHCLEAVIALVGHERYGPDIANNLGRTPLHCACDELDIPIATVIIGDRKCNVNLQTNTGQTPLHLAVGAQEVKPGSKLELIHLLLSYPDCETNDTGTQDAVPHNQQCDLNVRNSSGETPLHVAVKKNRCDILVALLHTMLCDPNVQNDSGETPLHIACSQLNSQTTEVLLKDGRCGVNAQINSGQTPLHLAVGAGEVVPGSKLELIHLLLSYPDYQSTDTSTQDTVLHNQQCDPNVRNSRGETPLHIACSSLNVEVVREFLKKGDCNVNLQTRAGQTPLHLAVRAEGGAKILLNRRVEIIRLLLTIPDCDPNIRDSRGDTPLIVACKKLVFHLLCTQAYFQIICTILSSSKCDPCIQNNNGNTALHFAAAGNCQETVKALVYSERYLSNVANINGQVPLHIACNSLQTGFVRVLLEDGRCNPNLQTVTGQTPLHLVVRAKGSNKVKIVRLLLAIPDCDPNIRNSEGDTPLMVACKLVNQQEFNCLVIKDLISCEQYKPDIPNKLGETPLHIACSQLNSQTIEVLLKDGRCDINAQTNTGQTPLHRVLTATPILKLEEFEGVVSLLLEVPHCDLLIADAQGVTPLQIAYQTDITCFMLMLEKASEEGYSKSKEVMKQAMVLTDNNLLHVLVTRHAEEATIIRCLLQWQASNLNVQNDFGETSLHIACRLRKYDWVVALTDNKQCNINIPDNYGHTALHKAIFYMDPDDLSIIVYLLSDSRSDVTACDLQGNTILHIACRKSAWRQDDSIVRVIRLLLSTGKVDPQCVNNAGETPVQLAVSNEQIVQELSSFSKAQLNHPIQTFVKIFVVGNAKTGKSTLVESLCVDANRLRRFVPAKFKTVKGVKPHTAGIVPISVINRHFGNAVIYDFAGQHEYYSSHAAVLENLVSSSPPVFLLTVNLSEPFDQICETVAYWWSFIGSYTTRSSSSPHVIIVGSHRDEVRSRGEKVQEILDRLLAAMKEVSTNFTLVGCVTLDCRMVASENLTKLLSMLKHTCDTVRKAVKIDFRCHILSSYLSDIFSGHMACTLADVIDSIKAEENTLLPQSTPDLLTLLATLSDKDRILLLKNSEYLEDSWIILQRQKLLGDINGIIFAPEYFDEYEPDFAGSTGIVQLSKLSKLDSKQSLQYPPEVITGFLSHLQFCFKIADPCTLELIATEETDLAAKEEFYFFPALVSCNNPPEEDIWDPANRQLKKRYGWLYECTHRYQYLMSRFLHVLILRLAFSYALAMEHEPSHDLPVVCRRCSVWKRGIAWRNNDGIETVVEVGLQNQWVVVMMQCPVGKKAECTQLRSSVINTVLNAKQDFCPEVAMNEYLMHPGIAEYPFQRTKQQVLYSIKEICKVIIEGQDYVLDKVGKRQNELAELLPCEPYIGLGKQLITQLFASECAQDMLSDRVLKEVALGVIRSNPDVSQQKLKLLARHLLPSIKPFLPPDGTSECVLKCTQLLQQLTPITFQNLREVLNKFSIFCGRNPWDLSGLSPATELLEGRSGDSEFGQPSEKTDDTLLGIEALLEVRTEVVPAVSHSASLGLALGLSQASKLQVIQHNWPDDVAFQLTEIMAEWLQGMGNSSWRSLAKALLDPAVGCPVIAQAIMEHHPQTHSILTDDDVLYQEVDEAPIDEPGDVLPAIIGGGHFSWFHLGLVLGLHYGTLKIIQIEHTSYTECVAVVITKWLNQVDSVGRQGQPSWRILARALAHPLVGQHRLADDVAKDHPTQEVTGGTSVDVSLPEYGNLSTLPHVFNRSLNHSIPPCPSPPSPS